MTTIVTKICSKCKKQKEITSFVKNKNAKDKLSFWCKECCSKNIKSWYKRNADAVKEKAKKRMRLNYLFNKEAVLSVVRKWKNLNKEKVGKTNKTWREKNREKCRMHERNYRAKRKAGGGFVSDTEWIELMSKHGNKCLCCKRKDKKLTMDHVVPISVGGTHTIDNIQPLCQSCNSKKRTTIRDYR